LGGAGTLSAACNACSLTPNSAAALAKSICGALPDTLPDMTPDVEQCIYRTTQEALTNVIRHAEAQQVDVALTYDFNGFVLRVQDNGLGFDAKQQQGGEHYGLVGMKERAALVGGELKIKSVQGQGTAVILTI
jgi:signal transduction histidine kinase